MVLFGAALATSPGLFELTYVMPIPEQGRNRRAQPRSAVPPCPLRTFSDNLDLAAPLVSSASPPETRKAPKFVELLCSLTARGNGARGFRLKIWSIDFGPDLPILRGHRANVAETHGTVHVVRTPIEIYRAPSGDSFPKQSRDSNARAARTRRTIWVAPTVFDIFARSCERVRRSGGDPIDQNSRKSARAPNTHSPDVKL